jgi:hypothetical protein
VTSPDPLTLWLVYEPGGNDMPLQLYGVFTSKDLADRAADVCAPDGYKLCLSVEPIQADAIYKTDLTKFWDVPNFFSYPAAQPNTNWDRMVVDSGGRLEIES